MQEHSRLKGSEPEMSGVCKKYKLSKDQISVYEWLMSQKINTKEDTLAYWAKKYCAKRIMEVVKFADERQKSGQIIRNLGGWINNFLQNGHAVVNDESNINREFTKQFVQQNDWRTVHIFEKYIREDVTRDDLPLTIPCVEYKRLLECLYNKYVDYK